MARQGEGRGGRTTTKQGEGEEDAPLLAGRRKELERLSAAIGINVEQQVADLDRADDGLLVVAYATALGMDLRRAFDPSIPLHQIPYAPRLGSTAREE